MYICVLYVHLCVLYVHLCVLYVHLCLVRTLVLCMICLLYVGLCVVCTSVSYLCTKLILRFDINVVLFQGGEITNPLQSAWSMAKELDHQHVYAKLSLVFTCWFSLWRLILLPLWSAHIVKHLLLEKNDIPESIARLWTVMIVAMIGGGAIWNYRLLKGFSKFTSSDQTKININKRQR